MGNTHFGNVNAYRQYDIGEVANKSDSLVADSDVVENALLMGYQSQNKEFSIAKDGIAGFVQKYALFEYDFAKQGGTGTVELRGTPIPKGAVIEVGSLFTEVAVAGSNVALGTAQKGDGTDISTNNIRASAALGSTGVSALLAANLSAQTDDIILTATFAGTATTGKFIAKVPYWVPVISGADVEYR